MLRVSWIGVALIAGCSAEKVDETTPEQGSEQERTYDTGVASPETDPGEDSTEPDSTEPTSDVPVLNVPLARRPDEPEHTQSDEDGGCGVRFTDARGVVWDYTDAFTEGAPVLLEDDGVLAFCPGEWLAQITVRDAEVTIMGLGDDRSETRLLGTGEDRVLTLEGPELRVNLRELVVERSEVPGGSASPDGGGLWCGDGATVDIRGAAFAGNRARSGGAIAAESGCHVRVEATLFTANDATNEGGAVRIDETSAVAVYRASFTDNRARDGGVFYVSGGALLMEEVNLENNHVTYYGGALVNDHGAVEIREATFVNHSAVQLGGVLYNLGEAVLSDVTIDTAVDRNSAIFHYAAHGDLQGDSVTFIDVAPADVFVFGIGGWSSAASEVYDFAPGASFTCDTEGCIER